jgi:transcriptional activator for dhaKLM operon
MISKPNPHPVDIFKAEDAILQDKLYPAWCSFVYNQQILSGVQPVIARSWKRCWARVNPLQPARSSHLNENNLLTSQLVSFDLLSIALPILEDVQQCGEGASNAILFANPAGCVLHLSGDKDILEGLEACGVVKGGFLTEDLVGTNAVGLALMERMPVEVVGCEHYVQSFHQFGSAAAPIFDLTGHSLGVVATYTTKKKYHPYGLGMVMVTAKAIEGQCQSEVLMNEQNAQMAELNAVLSAISEGILVFNSDNVIMHANLPASQLLGIPVKKLLGRTINPLDNIQPSVIDAIQSNTPITDKEVCITYQEQSVNVILSLRYVYNKNNLRWMIATLRPVKEIRQLVQHQMGASAPLTLDDIPGSSAIIRHVRDQVRKAAPATASILINGEPGTGKNALASAIHNLSQKREGPFVIFACGSIPNELVLPELLGYDESYVSKQIKDRPSKFELAEGGTLFFQDVDLLPLEAQTSVDIKSMISQKSFRSDLYYRLSIFAIKIPPLRERPQDIPEIIHRILNRLSYQIGNNVSLGPGVMEILSHYDWPDNIREIEAIIGKATMQVGQDGVIQIKDLPTSVVTANSRMYEEDKDFQISTLDEMEKQIILKTLKQCKGNITRVAEVLGISRTTLWRKLKAYEIEVKVDLEYMPIEIEQN